jgi:hypothetical protein
MQKERMMKARTRRILGIVAVLLVVLMSGAFVRPGRTVHASPGASDAARSLETDRSRPLQQTGGSPVVINEISPNPASGAEWVEVTRPTHQVFLPLILRNFTGGGIALGRVQPSASAANGLDLAGYELTDEDGNTFTIPDALPPLPLNGFVVIRFGAGTDETDFSDGRATLYTGADLAGSLADNRDQVALYATRSHNADTIVDFVAWGGPAGEDGANAVAAGLWQASEFVNLAVGGGAVEEGATLPQDRGLGLHPGRDWGTSAAWVVYQDGDLSPGTANPVPRAYWSNAGPAAEMSRDGFAIGWSVAPGARYRLQMDDNADFSSPEVDTRVDVPLYAPDVAPPVGHYWWRVRTRDDGVTSAW